MSGLSTILGKLSTLLATFFMANYQNAVGDLGLVLYLQENLQR